MDHGHQQSITMLHPQLGAETQMGILVTAFLVLGLVFTNRFSTLSGYGLLAK